MRSIAVAAIALESACGGGGGGGGSIGTTSPPVTQPVGKAWSDFQISVSPVLTMGTPSTAQVRILPVDALGNPISGPFYPTINITSGDTSGRTSLSGVAISDTTLPLAITYNGKGVKFYLSAAAAGGSVHTALVVSTLPKETVIANTAGPAELGPIGQLRLGSDGNLWSVFGGSGAQWLIGRITLGGQMTTIADPNVRHWSEYEGLVLGSDGNMWASYHDSFSEAPGINRVTPAGQVTSYALPGQPTAVGAMVAGPDGAIWFATGSKIWKITTSGTATFLADAGSSVQDMIVGPDNNIWFGVYGSGIGRITIGGVVTLFPLTAAAGSPSASLIVGPDGNFWSPYAFNAQTLWRFTTSGQVASSAALAYSAPWMSQAPPVIFPRDLAKDTGGDIYGNDLFGQGVFRVTPAGAVAEYPTYTAYALGNYGSNPVSVVAGSDGMMYVFSAAYPGPGLGVPSLTRINPTDW